MPAKINLEVSSLARSRCAADASREVVERWLLDGLDSVVTSLRIPYATTSGQSRILLGTSTVRRTAWARGIFANTRSNYFKNGSCHQARSPSVWQP